MAFVKKNVWLAFYVIIISGFLVLSTIVYLTYKNAYEDFKTQQDSITLMSANSLKALFEQQELVIDILIKQLQLHQKYTSKALSYEIISNAVNKDYAMQSFAIIMPNGKVFTTSWSLEGANNINLLDTNETKDDFKKTLESTKIVIGRTYYNPFLNKLIVPFRKAAFDQQGNVLFVVTSALDMETAFSFFVNNSKLSLLHDTYLFREHDRYFQVAPKEAYRDPKMYDYQIPLKNLEQGLEKLVNTHKIPVEQIKNNEMVISIIEDYPTRKSLMSSIFLKKYDLWLSTEIKLETINIEIYKKSAILSAIFLLIVIVFYWLFRNIAQAESQKQKALEFQANHDYLTHLKNRFFLDRYLSSLDASNPFSLLFIDTDNFKTINDNYGHEYGDKVLKEISKRLLIFKGENDLLIRYSGDEFLLILFEEDTSYIKTICQKILNSIEEPYDINESRFFLTASIGIAQFPKDGQSLDEIKRYADMAMYEAKKEKNSFVFFQDTLKEMYSYQSQLEHELKGALNRNELYMVYQPQMTNEDKIYGIEALLRWENPKLGTVPPDKFIFIAESIGLMPSIGRFVLEQSLRETREIEKDLKLSINISVKQFLLEDFVDTVNSIITEVNFKQIRLVFEVTENVFINDVDAIIKKLLQLKDTGIEISLDDFGTGYSSLSLLKKLPIDELKIDKSFVNDMLENANSYLMIEGIITIAKKLGMRILAEGIETKKQKELLENLGCHFYQGYFYAKPMRIEALKAFCLSNKK